MAQKSGFFNSTPDDIREYQAGEFAEYFSRFLSDGLYTMDSRLGLKVKAGTGLNVEIESGYAYIKGYIYKSDDIITKSIDAADAVLNRIDRVVVRLDITNRLIEVAIKKGANASSPNPPTLANTETVKELSLAQVIVNSGASSVSIIDERLTEYCGMVTLLVDAPFEDLFDVWDSWRDIKQAQFNDWMADLESSLSGNIAGNLQTLIDNNTANITINKNNITNLTNNKMDKSKITLSPNNAVLSQMQNGDIWIKYE